MRRVAPVEIREVEGEPRLRAVMIQEGRIARRRRELFAPHAVIWPPQGVGVLNRHRGERLAVATPERQADGRITISTRATPAIRQVFDSGRRHMSIEFFALEELRNASGVREVVKAEVSDVAMVRDPEYGQASAEIRRARGWRARVETGRRIACQCAGGPEIEFAVGAWEAMRLLRRGAFKDGVALAEFMRTTRGITDDALERIARRRDLSSWPVTAISRGANDVIADTSTGSLTLTFDRRGLGIAIAALDTEAGRRFTELARAGVPVYSRPIIDLKESASETDEDGVVRVSAALFRHVLVRPVAARPHGIDPLEPDRREGRALSRRRRLLIAGAA